MEKVLTKFTQKRHNKNSFGAQLERKHPRGKSYTSRTQLWWVWCVFCAKRTEQSLNHTKKTKQRQPATCTGFCTFCFMKGPRLWFCTRTTWSFFSGKSTRFVLSRSLQAMKSHLVHKSHWKLGITFCLQSAEPHKYTWALLRKSKDAPPLLILILGQKRTSFAWTMRWTLVDSTNDVFCCRHFFKRASSLRCRVYVTLSGHC